MKSVHFSVGLAVALAFGLAAALSAAPVASSAAPRFKTINFPTDQSVGTLKLVTITPAADLIDGSVLGPARGAVRVPADKPIRLQINFHGAEDLSFLDKLAPDDLAVLILNNDGPGFDTPDKAYVHLGRLTGLQFINLEDSEAGTVAMRAVGQLPNLVGLNVGTTLIKDEDVALIAGLKKLRFLELNHNHLSDASLVSCRGFSELRRLRARRCGFTASGLKNLASAKHLQELVLSDNRFGDEGLSGLPVLPELSYIDIGNCELSDKTFVSLSRDLKLYTLLACYGHYTKVGFAALAKLPVLAELSAEGYPIKSGDLAALAPSPKLCQICVTISPEPNTAERAALQKLIPRVRLALTDPRKQRKERYIDVMR